MNRQYRIDLHVHSTASDGQYTPKQIILMAKKQNIETIALTDHDTTAGFFEAYQAAKSVGVRLISGIELDTKYSGIEGNFHILGYGIDSSHPSLVKMCTDLVEQREKRAERIFDYLKKYHVCPTRQRVYKFSNGGIIGRPHFARAMVEEGLVSSIKDAFIQYLDTPEFKTIERYKPHPKEAIRIINESGGIAVLAHPSQIKLGEHTLFELLTELKQYGLGGLECYYSTHTMTQTNEYLKLTNRLGLYVTGGSDFHGEKIKPEIKLGQGIAGSLNIPETLKILEVI